jgi:glycosyltransferase involved in cell wall biosynthesis
VPVDDAAKLAEAIAALAADKPRARALAEAGHALYATQFSEAPVVARYRDFLGSVTR